MGGNLYTETTEKSVPVVTTPTTEVVATTVEVVPSTESTGTTPAVGADTATSDAVVPPSPSVAAQ